MPSRVKTNTGIINIALGLVSIGGSLLVNWLFASSVVVFTNPILGALKLLSYLTFSVSVVGLCASLIGVKQFLKSYPFVEGSWPSLISLVGKILGTRKYLLTLLISAVVYGLLYAAVSSIIVYRPDRDFAVEYFAVIPSVVTTVCCDAPGFIPVFTVYVTNHLGLLLVPVNVILMVAVSALVGHNVAVGHYVFDNRPKGVGLRWLGGFGAITGLFTACPTCAGIFLGSLIQTAGAEALAATLAIYQPLFIGVTFFVLIGSNYLLVRSIRQVLYGSCKLRSNPK
jgi:hypothetical protein